MGLVILRLSSYDSKLCVLWVEGDVLDVKREEVVTKIQLSKGFIWMRRLDECDSY